MKCELDADEAENKSEGGKKVLNALIEWMNLRGVRLRMSKVEINGANEVIRE